MISLKLMKIFKRLKLNTHNKTAGKIEYTIFFILVKLLVLHLHTHTQFKMTKAKAFQSRERLDSCKLI